MGASVGFFVGESDGSLVGECEGCWLGAFVSGHHVPATGVVVFANTCMASPPPSGMSVPLADSTMSFGTSKQPSSLPAFMMLHTI